MKKYISLGLLLITFTMFNNVIVFANPGDIGFWGGITEGRSLPKTTETILIENGKTKPPTTDTFMYKEIVFLGGVPSEFSGTMSITTRGGVLPDTTYGTYTQTFVIEPDGTNPGTTTIDRSITFDVNYRVEGTQIIKDYKVKSWSETITTPEGSYTLNPDLSNLSISIIEDDTPGVIYYKGNISEHAVYDAGGSQVVQDINGSFYGYTNAWSSTETQRLNGTITTPEWQMQYQVRPSVMVYKTLQYDKNEPTAISFEGNYQEVMRNRSGLEYDIYEKPSQFYDVPSSGSATIESFSTFEQLIAPDMSYLNGHWAQSDIEKLFAMQVLEGDPKYYQPDQAMTRGEFTTALSKAIKLPVTPIPVAPTNANATTANATPVDIVFPDVVQEDVDYPYIMAAYEQDIAIGRANGYFATEEPIQRQEAIVMMMRALGLTNVAPDPSPITPFVDDAEIAPWAKQDVYAAYTIGLIQGDEQGYLHPTEPISKAEGAAMLNRLIEYMSYDISQDYTERIVNYSN